MTENNKIDNNIWICQFCNEDELNCECYDDHETEDY